MNFCSQLPELQVIMYVSSLRVLACNCVFVHMNTPYYPTWEKRTFCHSTRPWECLDLRIQSSMVILLSSCRFRRLVFSLQPLVLRHVEALGCSSYWYPCLGYFEHAIMSLFPVVWLTTFWKKINNYVPYWACICIACAFGNLGWTNVHTHRVSQCLPLYPWCLVTLLSHN
jgi:hypothetical protein